MSLNYSRLVEAYTPSPVKPLNALSWRRVVVLVPHPDDETIGCGGLLAALDDWGIPVHLILVSNGDGNGELPPNTDTARYSEFCSAIQTLGPHITHEYWALPDGHLAECKDLLSRIQTAVASYQPSVLLAPWPGDIHPDHRTLGQLAAQLQAKAPLPQGVVFYEVWSPLPASHLVRITPWWHRKQSALNCHRTALQYGAYDHAMAGLSAYRSLLASQQTESREYAEAFYVVESENITAGIQYRYAQQADGPAIERLFTDVFETTLPEGWWQWKYGGNPLPGALAIDESGREIAFYGALPRTAEFENSTYDVCQQGDVMVHKAARFATRRAGVFPSLSRHFLEREVGDGRRFALAFGFPTPRAMALGVRLGLYKAADPVFIWDSPAQPTRLPFGCRYHTDNASQVTDWSWVNRLSALPMGAENCIRLKRTSQYWCQRFAQHPQKDYQLIRLFRWGALIAAAIVSSRDNRVELLDIALKHQKYWPALLNAVKDYTAQHEYMCLQVWGTSAAIEAFPEGNRTPAGSVALPGKQLESSLGDKVAGHCWFIGGDTDFR